MVVYDKSNRARHERLEKKIVILVALGFWTDDGPVPREIIDWQIAESENHEAWEILLHRLVERGVSSENGLQVLIRDGCGGLGQAVAHVYGTSVVDQRCIWHRVEECP